MENLFDDNTLDSSNQIIFVSIDSITPKKYQPRKYFDSDALSELATSIAAHGVIQPLIVREKAGADAGYEIIAGERRYRASKLAGLSEVPCIVMDAGEVEAAELALIENIQRENLNPYEEAKAYRTLIDDFGLSQEEMAKQVGKSRPAIANSLRLLELPESIVNMLVEREISAGHARALLAVKDEAKMEELAAKIVKNGLSVRDTEAAVRRIESQSTEKGSSPAGSVGVHVNYYEELERKVTGLIGRKVRIANGKNKRSIQIEYTDNKDLEDLLAKLCGENIIETE